MSAGTPCYRNLPRLLQFGIPKYDNGERFDLKAPYTDEGWVDEGGDPLGWAKSLFGGGKKKEELGGKSKEESGGRARSRRASADEAKGTQPQAKPERKLPWQR